ncbi:MAG: hypothetical protein WD850_01145 [Candidatus Spechtbacterales bacterium]
MATILPRILLFLGRVTNDTVLHYARRFLLIPVGIWLFIYFLSEWFGWERGGYPVGIIILFVLTVASIAYVAWKWSVVAAALATVDVTQPTVAVVAAGYAIAFLMLLLGAAIPLHEAPGPWRMGAILAIMLIATAAMWGFLRVEQMPLWITPRRLVVAGLVVLAIAAFFSLDGKYSWGVYDRVESAVENSSNVGELQEEVRTDREERTIKVCPGQEGIEIEGEDLPRLSRKQLALGGLEGFRVTEYPLGCAGALIVQPENTSFVVWPRSSRGCFSFWILDLKKGDVVVEGLSGVLVGCDDPIPPASAYRIILSAPGKVGLALTEQ